MTYKAYKASQKSSFSTGFIRFFDMAECYVVYSENPNAFLIILEAILRLGSKMMKVRQVLYGILINFFWRSEML